MAKQRRPGRPPRAGKAATERLEVRLTVAERRAWEKAAGKLSLSEWLRALGNAAAG